MAWSMAPLIEVPPPNNCRGAASMASAKALAEAASLISVHGTTCTCMAGPVHCTMVTAIEPVAPPRIASSTCWLAERIRIAPALQFEARLVDAARGVDRQHQQDVGFRQRWVVAPSPARSAASSAAAKTTMTAMHPVMQGQSFRA